MLRAWILLLMLALPMNASAQADQALREAELEALRDRIEGLRTHLDEVRGERQAASDELQGVERDIARRLAAIEALERELKVGQARLHALRKDEAGLRDGMRDQQEALAVQARAAYLMGRQPYLKLLLNQQDPASLGRVMRYYDYLSRARSSAIAELDNRARALAVVQASVRAEVQSLEGLRGEQLREARALEQARTERAALVARLREELREGDRELSRLREDERRLESLLQELREALAEAPRSVPPQQFARLKGTLRWPVEGTVNALPRGRRERGVVIRSEEGAPVEVVSHGRVIFADWLRGYGMLLIVDHGEGYMSLYGYNQRVKKRVGDWVEAGEVVAHAGRGGVSNDAAGLYFELRHNGKPINPQTWCRPRG